MFVGDAPPFGQADVIVAGTGEDGLDALDLRQAVVKVAGNSQRHVLFFESIGANGAGVATAVPRVDRDHHVPQMRGLRRIRGNYGLCTRGARCTGGAGLVVAAQLENQLPGAARVSTAHERSRRDVGSQVEHQSFPVAVKARGVTDVRDEVVTAGGGLQMVGQLRIEEIEHHACGMPEREYPVVDIGRHIQYGPRALAILYQAELVDVGRAGLLNARNQTCRR